MVRQSKTVLSRDVLTWTWTDLVLFVLGPVQILLVTKQGLGLGKIMFVLPLFIELRFTLGLGIRDKSLVKSLNIRFKD